MDCTQPHPRMQEVFTGRALKYKISPFDLEKVLASISHDSQDARDPEKAITEALEGLKEFLVGTEVAVEALVKKQVIDDARYIVCTAATAVKLPMRMRSELSAALDQHELLRYTELSQAHQQELQEFLTTRAKHKSILNLKLPGEAEGGSSALVAALQLQARCIASGDRDSKDKALAKLVRSVLICKYVVLDEAGGMLEPDMVGTIIHGCKFLLCVGDHRQLPPFTKWRNADKNGYATSLLERLAQEKGVSKTHNMMTEQYRMPPKLAGMVSDIFYDGSLTTPDAVAAARTHPAPVLFVDVQGSEECEGKSFKNEAEVRAVVKIVRDAVAKGTGDPGQTVNVIAFHRPQSFALQDALRAAGLGPEVEVMTVDSMQGREADVVVLSCVRSGSKLGFLNNRKRLNVAISRARQQLYIVGNKGALNGAKSRLWKRLLKHKHLADVDVKNI